MLSGGSGGSGSSGRHCLLVISILDSKYMVVVGPALVWSERSRDAREVR